MPPLAGERWWRQPPKGENAEMVSEVYDSLFFPSYLSFPLEGKSREEAKGVRGRVPIGCSIAVLTANRQPPERSDAQRTHFALANWICRGASATRKSSESVAAVDALCELDL